MAFHTTRLGVGLMASLLVGPPAVSAQIVAVPESLRVVVSQGAEETQALTLAVPGGQSIAFCVDLDRPLQRTNQPAFGAGCGPPGELLARRDASASYPLSNPEAITMTPDGRLFVADRSGLRRTYELEPDLTFVRMFDHPTVAEVAPFPRTDGITYNEDTGTLWWTNNESVGDDILRVMLLEGTLEGVPTGRRIILPGVSGPPPAPFPRGAAYDPRLKRYYYSDVRNETLWAIDTTGNAVTGYPVTLQRYAGVPHGVGNGPDVHGESDGGPEGVRIEMPVVLAGELSWRRVIVADPAGGDLGLETPIPSLPCAETFNSGFTIRSRLDPNGVMYAVFTCRLGPGEWVDGMMAFRPVPLSPSWLTLSPWMGEVPAGGSSALTLTFRAGQRVPGEYRSTLLVEDTSGAVLASVPLTLVVTPDTPNEPGPAPAGAVLAVAPNPVRTYGWVALTLPIAAVHAFVAVFDVLGRQVLLVHEGPLPAGRTALRLEASALPAGVYTLRTTGPAEVSLPFTVMR